VIRAGCAAAVLGWTASPLQALDTQLSARAAVWSSSRSLDDEKDLTPLQLWIRSSATFEHADTRFRLYGEGWTEVQPNGTDSRTDGRLREAYVQLSRGAFELRGGWQIFAWGRADGINPTDNLTPRKLTFLTRDTEDQRFGTPALRGTWFSGPISMNLIWLPGFDASEMPWPKQAPDRHDVDPSNRTAQWATRLELVRGDFEGSISYFDGYDVLPSQAIMTSSSPQILVIHDRLKIAGADFAKTFGRVVLRSELAHTETAAAHPGAVFVKQPQWYVVAGGERSFGEYLDINLQYYYRHVDGEATPYGLPAAAQSIARVFAVTAQQYDRIDHGLTLRLADQWLNETLEASVSGVLSLERRAFLLRPVIKYRATDAWTISIGAEVFRGDDRTLYGFLKSNSTSYIELRWGF
jgi:hypothetical protein